MSERDRIRWQCRRGLLELDLVLSSFLQRHLDRLRPGELAAFGRLLEEPDNQLLDLVMGRAQNHDPEREPILELLRQKRDESLHRNGTTLVDEQVLTQRRPL
jgi:succinate dehydrogenase flavin-adding protein (antitoxin of CptAB toxin-antitoxin module)